MAPTCRLNDRFEVASAPPPKRRTEEQNSRAAPVRRRRSRWPRVRCRTCCGPGAGRGSGHGAQPSGSGSETACCRRGSRTCHGSDSAWKGIEEATRGSSISECGQRSGRTVWPGVEQRRESPKQKLSSISSDSGALARGAVIRTCNKRRLRRPSRGPRRPRRTQ